jgi:single-stranded-DNA-specific exonuclease
MRLSLTEKEWLIQQADESAVSHLAQALSVSPLLARVLYLRGIRTQPEGEAFLNAGLSQLHNPLRIPGITAAADRLALAIEKRERICVYGDYDVDGVTATSLLVLVLRRLGVEVFPFLPNRMTHGYGLHPEAIREIAASAAKLLVTVDNGISAVEEIALARSLGMDVIVTDHHEPPEALPETPFLVNPKIHLGNEGGTRAEQVEPFAALAGVGIAFSLLVAVRGRLRESGRWAGRKLPNLREYLDLVAIGTVGDVVPLVSDNRILVAHGLREIERTNNIGLRALLRVSGLMGKPVTPGRVGFVLAPRINAAGRLGDAEMALRLLTSRDEREVQQAADLLNQENRGCLRAGREGRGLRKGARAGRPGLAPRRHRHRGLPHGGAILPAGHPDCGEERPRHRLGPQHSRVFSL